MASIGNDNEDQINLNIMPMLDIFSILILFLLFNFSTEPVNHELNKNVDLPESATLNSLDEVPSIVVTKNEILVNGKKIVPLINKNISSRETSQGAIHKLFVELEKISNTNKRFIKNDKKKKSQSITLEVDKDHNFGLIKKVMISAQQADFVTFKFMVSKSRS